LKSFGNYTEAGFNAAFCVPASASLASFRGERQPRILRFAQNDKAVVSAALVRI
jgi:hypothetical protein